MTSFLDCKEREKPARCWYALYTRPRFEKRIDDDFRQLGIQSFLPLQTVVRTWSDRKKRIQEPLFPSYLFIQANLQERVQALQVRGIVRMVSFNGEPTRVPDYQIDAVKRLMNGDFVPEPHPYLAEGDRVEVVRGVLTGLQGFVVSGRPGKYFVISIDALGKSLAIKIDARLLRRLPPYSATESSPIQPG